MFPLGVSRTGASEGRFGGGGGDDDDDDGCHDEWSEGG